MSNKKLHILTYDHGGYVLWKDEVKPRLLKIFEWLEKYPKLRIGLDYESFTFDEFSRCDKEVVDLTKKLLDEYPDRVGFGATTYGQPLSLTINDESNARQLLYAVRTNLEYFGKTPDVYAISEFALNNQTPQLIAQCGYKAALLRSHVMGYGYPKNYDSAWGKWIGKDGTEMPSVPTYPKQGRGFNCTTVDNWILSRWPVDSDLYSLEDFEEMFKKYTPLLASRYDDLTQPIEEVVAHTQNKDNYEYVLLEDIPSIYGEPVDEYITDDNDFHVQMPWGYCGNEIFNGCRQGETDAVVSERLNAMSLMLGDKSYEELSKDAWKYVLAAEHHDVTICGLLDLSRRFIPASLENSGKVKDNSLRFIAQKFGDKNEVTLVVINHHSFMVNDYIQVPVSDDYSIFDGDKALECEVISTKDGKVLTFCPCLPPMSIKKFTLKKGEVKTNSLFRYDENEKVLTTPCYVVKFNKNGISYIKDVVTDKFVFDNADESIFTGNINGKDSCSVGQWNVSVNALSAQAHYEGEIGGVPFELTMSFAGKSKRIDCKSRFDVKNDLIGRTDVTQGRPVPFTLNGHHHEDKLCLNINLSLDNNRRMFRDLPYSISEWYGDLRKTEKYWYPNDDILIDTPVSPEESFNSTTYFHGIHWLCLRDKNQGLAVFNKGCMGCAVTGNKVRVPLIYSNEYMCGTRILDGSFENEFSLFHFESTLSNIDIHKNALIYAQPPVFEEVAKGEGAVNEFTALSFEGDGNVILTALYPEKDYVLARFCNYSDNSAKAEISTEYGTVLSQTDLLGNDVAKIENNTLSFHPWEVKTVKIILN